MLKSGTWWGHWLGGAGVHHGVTLTLAQPKCVPLQYLRHSSLMTKIYGLLQLIINVVLCNCDISIDSNSPVNTYYSFIILVY